MVKKIINIDKNVQIGILIILIYYYCYPNKKNQLIAKKEILTVNILKINYI